VTRFRNYLSGAQREKGRDGWQTKERRDCESKETGQARLSRISIKEVHSVGGIPSVKKKMNGKRINGTRAHPPKNR